MLNLSNFGEIVRDAMIDANLSLSKLSKLSKVPKSALSVYIHGSSYPLVTNLIKISNFFDVSVDYLLGRTDKKKKPPKAKLNEGFFDRFQNLLEQNNLSFNKFASDLKISTSTCSKWKAGLIPNTPNLILVADYFCVSVDYLLGLTDKK